MGLIDRVFDTAGKLSKVNESKVSEVRKPSDGMGWEFEVGNGDIFVHISCPWSESAESDKVAKEIAEIIHSASKSALDKYTMPELDTD